MLTRILAVGAVLTAAILATSVSASRDNPAPAVPSSAFHMSGAVCAAVDGRLAEDNPDAAVIKSLLHEAGVQVPKSVTKAAEAASGEETAAEESETAKKLLTPSAGTCSGGTCSSGSCASGQCGRTGRAAASLSRDGLPIARSNRGSGCGSGGCGSGGGCGGSSCGSGGCSGGGSRRQARRGR
jgi:hypothetical protein